MRSFPYNDNITNMSQLWSGLIVPRLSNFPKIGNFQAFFQVCWKASISFSNNYGEESCKLCSSLQNSSHHTLLILFNWRLLQILRSMININRDVNICEILHFHESVGTLHKSVFKITGNTKGYLSVMVPYILTDTFIWHLQTYLKRIIE